MTIASSKVFFIFAAVFYLVALILTLAAPDVDPKTRIAFFYAGCACLATGFAI